MQTILITHKGYCVDLANPDPSTICLEDIAHSLSALIRFNGHLRDNDIERYSIAEHCMRVADKVEQMAIAGGADISTQIKLVLNAILHDAHEAYVGEITRPVASLLDFRAPVERLKARLQNAIHKHLLHTYEISGAFYLEEHQRNLIHNADRWAQAFEAYHLHSTDFVAHVPEWRGILSNEDKEKPDFRFYRAGHCAQIYLRKVVQQLADYKNDLKK